MAPTGVQEPGRPNQGCLRDPEIPQEHRRPPARLRLPRARNHPTLFTPPKFRGQPSATGLLGERPGAGVPGPAVGRAKAPRQATPRLPRAALCLSRCRLRAPSRPLRSPEDTGSVQGLCGWRSRPSLSAPRTLSRRSGPGGAYEAARLPHFPFPRLPVSLLRLQEAPY